MRRLLIVGLTAVLSACAMTPAELRDTGTRTNHESTLSPARFAACVQSNAEGQNLMGRVRDGATPQDRETLVYVPVDGALSSVMIADTTPRDTGSRSVIYLNGRAFSPEKLRATLLTGC